MFSCTKNAYILNYQKVYYGLKMMLICMITISFNFLFNILFSEKRKSALMKQDMKNVRHELNVQLQELDAKNKKLEVLQALNDQRPKTVTTKHTNANGCFESLKIDLNVPTNQSHISFKKHDELELQMSLEKVKLL
jgi:hypothetical protein